MIISNRGFQGHMLLAPVHQGSRKNVTLFPAVGWAARNFKLVALPLFPLRVPALKIKKCPPLFFCMIVSGWLPKQRPEDRIWDYMGLNWLSKCAAAGSTIKRGSFQLSAVWWLRVGRLFPAYLLLIYTTVSQAYFPLHESLRIVKNFEEKKFFLVLRLPLRNS